MQAPEVAAWDVERVRLATLVPGCALEFEVLLASAGWGGGSRLVAAGDTGGTRLGAPRAGVAGLSGVLACGACSWSWAGGREGTGGVRSRARDVPVGWVPLGAASDHVVTAFLAASLVPGYSPARGTTPAHGDVTGMVVLSASSTPACDGLVAPAWQYVDACAAAELVGAVAACNLSFVPPRGEGAAAGHMPTSLSLISPQHAAAPAVLLDGTTVPLGRVRGWWRPGIADADNDTAAGRIRAAVTRQAPVTGGVTGAAQVPGRVREQTRLTEALRFGRSLLRAAAPALYGAGTGTAAAATTGTGSDSEESAPPQVLLEATAESNAAGAAAAAAAAGAALGVGVGGIDKLIGPVMDGLLKPAVGAVSGVLGGVLGDAVGKLMSSMIDAGLTAEIASLLTKSLGTSVSEAVVPPLTAALSDAITNTLGPQLRDAVADAAAARLVASLTDSLSATLADALAAQLEVDVPAAVAESLPADLVHALTQSVTQAVVPALTHTLHHSPAEDYFCTYCATAGLYCAYCRKDGPEQLYRAQYYAAYYSKYYADALGASGNTGNVPLPPDGLPPPRQR